MRADVSRSQLQEMNDPGTIRHYHRVDTLLWLGVARMLQRLAVAALDEPSQVISCYVGRSQVIMIWDFLDEMEWGYVHPRRSSIRRSLSPYRRVAPQNVTANPLTN